MRKSFNFGQLMVIFISIFKLFWTHTVIIKENNFQISIMNFIYFDEYLIKKWENSIPNYFIISDIKVSKTWSIYMILHHLVAIKKTFYKKYSNPESKRWKFTLDLQNNNSYFFQEKKIYTGIRIRLRSNTVSNRCEIMNLKLYNSFFIYKFFSPELISNKSNKFLWAQRKLMII
jgi:hypothetical protein